MISVCVLCARCFNSWMLFVCGCVYFCVVILWCTFICGDVCLRNVSFFVLLVIEGATAGVCGGYV